jgi:hypothetical protein
MNLLYLLFTYIFLTKSNSEPIIKNINIPSCRNCIHYKPTLLNDFTSPLNKCEKFGEKNIITDEITYRFADLCRNDESACGKEGKYFEKDENIDKKILKYKIGKIITNPLILVLFLYSILIFQYFFYIIK